MIEALLRTTGRLPVIRRRSAAGMDRRLHRIAALAVDCLLLEVGTYPKPGLVSHIDSGSHCDMDADTLRCSAEALRPFLHALAQAGAEDCAMNGLRVIGKQAEAAMLKATQGINTHRGAIFGLGLLCAAAGARPRIADIPPPLGVVVERRWGEEILAGPMNPRSHGMQARHHHGAGGARCEAAHGFPSVYEIGLPALRQASALGTADAEAIRVHACFSLIAVVEDTNLLHRGGTEGLQFAQRAAQGFLHCGGVNRPDWRTHARAVHETFVARRLSPGGSADLLAMSLFVQEIEMGIL